jgi:hypothetical protein
MSEPTPLETLVNGIVGGRANEQVRSAAARGALPLPRPTLVRLQILLLEDAAEPIRAAARASLDGLSKDEVLEVLAEPDCFPEVLAHYARTASRDEAMAEQIAFHRTAPKKALATLAANGNAAVIDLVMTNQERLLVEPALLELLILNPALRPDQRSRLLELLERASKLAEERSGPGGEAESGADEYEEAARLLQVDVGDLLSTSEILGAEELECSEDLEIRNAYAKIITLNSAQKAILAMKGGREERLILVRDTNKVVALGVLKNPRINEQEIQGIAKMRNVTDEVLRQVGSSRAWTKSYPVILALINNPRTPQSVSMNFIPRLSNRDLKSLSKNRDIPELIRRSAGRTLDVRTQRQAGPFRKR